MSDDEKNPPASAAWQDVNRYHWNEMSTPCVDANCTKSHWLDGHSVEHARAADAQQIAALRAALADDDGTVVLQAVLDAIKGTLDPHTQIADHPNVKFAQMERLKLEQQIAALLDEIHQWRKTVSYAVGDMADTETPESCRAAMMQGAAQDGRERDTLHTQIAALQQAASHALELIASHGGDAPANHMAWHQVYNELTAVLNGYDQHAVVSIRLEELAALRAENEIDKEIAGAQLTALQAKANALACENLSLQSAFAFEQHKCEALQAEQAQWQQKAAKIFASINEWCNNDAGLTNEEVVEWRDQLAALTAQPDGSLPTRQPKP